MLPTAGSSPAISSSTTSPCSLSYIDPNLRLHPSPTKPLLILGQARQATALSSSSRRQHPAVRVARFPTTALPLSSPRPLTPTPIPTPRTRTYALGSSGFGAPGGGGGFGNDSPLILDPDYSPTSRPGGPPGGRGGAPRRPPLVLPGRQGPPSSSPTAAPGRGIIFPDKGPAGGGGMGGSLIPGPEVNTVTGPNKYRPPPGFMSDAAELSDPELLKMDPMRLVDRLKAGVGRWYHLARLLPPLYMQHLNSSLVEELTGVTPLVQNQWLEACAVRDSLLTSGQFTEEELEFFDARGDELLPPFRFLSQEMRYEAAKYIMDNNLDEEACKLLARSLKEWERRPLERTGFTEAPGDCLAFKFFRDALECRTPEEVDEKLRLAVKVCVSDTARRMVEAAQRAVDEERRQLEAGALGTGLLLPGSSSSKLALLQGSFSSRLMTAAGGTTTATAVTAAASGGGGIRSTSGSALLSVLRLGVDEVGTRPLPVLGEYGEASVAAAEGAPRTSQEGAFGVFLITAAATEYKWVALPLWKALAMAQHPLALTVSSLAAHPAITQALRCTTEDDRRRMRGPGIIVADKGPSSVPEAASEAVDAHYYLASRGAAGGRLELVDGKLVKEQGVWRVHAKVLFLARPPKRDAPGGTASDFLKM